MKWINLMYVCLLASGFCCCNSKTNQKSCNETNTQEPIYEDSINTEEERQPIVNSKNIDGKFIKLYTMRENKENDHRVIGDLYVKFENDSLFKYLYVINESDTVYSIKENVFFYKDGTVDFKKEYYIIEDTGEIIGDVVYGYTFGALGNDNFYVNLWDKNGNCAGESISIMWNYEEEKLEFLRPSW